MTQIQEFFKGMKLNTYYKYLLYLSGIIFILSLFFEVKGVDAGFVRNNSFWIIIVALVTWAFDEFVQNINRYVYELYIRKPYSFGDDPMKNYYHISFMLLAISRLIELAVWAVALQLLFGR